MTTSKLKPCPFCGSIAQMLGGPEAQETYSVWCKAKGRRHHIHGTMDAEQTAAIWNTRADHDRLIAEAVAKERERCAKMVEDDFGVITDRKVSWKPDVMLSVAAAIREGK